MSVHSVTTHRAAVLILCAIALIGAGPRADAQTTWFVNASVPAPGLGTPAWPFGGYSAIQTAMNNASDGDTILVDGGSYGNMTAGFNTFIQPGTLEFSLIWSGVGGPAVIEPPAGTTTVGGILMDGGQSSATVIDGFTIRGHFCLGTPALTIQSLGGQPGDHSIGSHPRIRNCIIEDNGVFGYSAYGGGGMAIGWSCRPLVQNCIIRNNEVTSGVGGGGVWIYGDIGTPIEPVSNYPDPTFVGCTFQGNDTLGVGQRGGGVMMESAFATFVDCNFLGNTAFDCGGGLYVNNSPETTLYACEFDSNTSQTRGGGGLYATTGSFLLAEDCTFAANLAVDGGGACVIDSDVVVNRCCFRKNFVDQTLPGQEVSGSALAIFTESPGASASLDVVNSLLYFNFIEDYGWSAADLERHAVVWAHADVPGTSVDVSILNSTMSEHDERGVSLRVGAGAAVDLTVHNSILWQNGAGMVDPSVHVDAGTTLVPSIDVLYSNTDQGIAGSGNLSTDPLFLAPGAGDFHLDPTASPSLNAGRDSLYTGSAPFTSGLVGLRDKELDRRIQGVQIEQGCFEEL